jgi:hypothetical protein
MVMGENMSRRAALALGHDRPEPWDQGSSYVNGTEPFASQVGDIVKGSVAYPPL